MKYDSNKKDKFAARCVRIAALFALIVSSALFAQAQNTRPFGEQQLFDRKRQMRDDLIRQVVGGIIRTIVDHGKRDKPLPGLLQPIAPVTPSLSSLSSSSLGNIFAAPTQPVFVAAPSFAAVQSGSLQNNALANSNSQSPNSDLQDIPSLDVAGDLGNGTVILRDAAGKLYSARLTGAPSAARTTRQRATRRARP